MGFGDVVGKILTTAGLGQNELVEVTRGCLDRIDRVKKMISPAERDAIAFSLGSMVDELRQRDVATSATADEMHKVIQTWLSK